MKLTDEMVEAAQDTVMRAMHTRNLSAWHPDTIRAALTAALSAAPPNADAVREVAAPVGEVPPNPLEPGVAAALGPAMTALCEDCPPPGYTTDKTRCLPCPRRLRLTGHQTALLRAIVAGDYADGSSGLSELKYIHGDEMRTMAALQRQGLACILVTRHAKTTAAGRAALAKSEEAAR